jgi:multiple sugar transport system substrate-binding protein
MSEPVVLRGSSWDHERGHSPMVATAAEYERRCDGAVRIEWKPRSLKAFGTAHVEELAADFDLILIDHPHIGAMAESGAVVPLDELVDADAIAELAAGSPGRSHQSYEYDGHLWALAVDAACQVAAWRPDLITDAPRTWDEVSELARSGQVLWPLCDVDSAASFLSLTALAGRPCGFGESEFADRDVGRFALETMCSVADRSDPRCLSMNPISALDALSASDDFVYSPLLFGYVNYSRLDVDRPRVSFGDVPVVLRQPSGALLGGVGLAVSSNSRAIAEAVDYARYVADPGTQRAVYFRSGGQPAHASAWTDPEVDRLGGGFFSGTKATIAGAWTRPRRPSFVGFQNEMIALFGNWRSRAERPDELLDDLQRLHEQALRGKA